MVLGVDYEGYLYWNGENCRKKRFTGFEICMSPLLLTIGKFCC